MSNLPRVPPDPDDRSARCETCGDPATCLGRYEDMETPAYSCDTHCGHGCEDGECRPLAAVPELVAKLSEWNEIYGDRAHKAKAEIARIREAIHVFVNQGETTGQMYAPLSFTPAQVQALIDAAREVA